MNIKFKMALLVAVTATIMFSIFFSAKTVAEPLEGSQVIDYLEPAHEETELSNSSIKEYAKNLVIDEWGFNQWDSFNNIIHKESSWKVTGAHYSDGKSSATGLAGFLDATWETVGCTKSYDERVQLECAIKYIQQRYGTPDKALDFHLHNGWY